MIHCHVGKDMPHLLLTGPMDLSALSPENPMIPCPDATDVGVKWPSCHDGGLANITVAHRRAKDGDLDTAAAGLDMDQPP